MGVGSQAPMSSARLDRNMQPGLVQGRIIQGAKGDIAQGHHEIGGPTLADCKMDILVAYIIFLKGTYILEHLGSWLLGLTASLLAGKAATYIFWPSLGLG